MADFLQYGGSFIVSIAQYCGYHGQSSVATSGAQTSKVTRDKTE